jgi:hypothetical protein
MRARPAPFSALQVRHRPIPSSPASASRRELFLLTDTLRRVSPDGHTLAEHFAAVHGRRMDAHAFQDSGCGRLHRFRIRIRRELS